MAIELDCIKRVYQTRKGTDFIINYNGHEYKVHLDIIASKSKYFQKIICDDFKERREGRIDISFDFISQRDFEHFLQYFYGFELEVERCVPLYCLADYFQCDSLQTELKKNPIYRLRPSEEALQKFALLELPVLSLDGNWNVSDEHLWNSLLWFTANIDSFIAMKKEVLCSIPLDWLRFAFGTAPVHLFQNELKRLDKALELYAKCGPSEELFATLFEGIRFIYIPADDMLAIKYLPLYRTQNDIVTRNLMNTRVSSLSYKELQVRNAGNFRGCVSLTLEVDDYATVTGELQVQERLSKDISCELSIRKLDDATCSVFVKISSATYDHSYKAQLSYFLCVVENNMGQVTFHDGPSQTVRVNTWKRNQLQLVTHQCKKVSFFFQLLSFQILSKQKSFLEYVS
jgi:hypothetical protein